MRRYAETILLGCAIALAILLAICADLAIRMRSDVREMENEIKALEARNHAAGEAYL